MEIVLIRHGKPKVNKDVKLDSTSFAFWMAKYDRCNICKKEKPPKQLKQKICDHFIVSSHMPRAITSSQLCLGKMPDLIEKVLEIGRSGLQINRYKGLGEMNPEQLWETTLDPQKRTLLKVQMEDEMLLDETFVRLMGEKVEPRREYIQSNAKKVVNLDI